MEDCTRQKTIKKSSRFACFSFCCVYSWLYLQVVPPGRGDSTNNKLSCMLLGQSKSVTKKHYYESGGALILKRVCLLWVICFSALCKSSKPLLRMKLCVDVSRLQLCVLPYRIKNWLRLFSMCWLTQTTTLSTPLGSPTRCFLAPSYVS